MPSPRAISLRYISTSLGGGGLNLTATQELESFLISSESGSFAAITMGFWLSFTDSLMNSTAP